MRCPEALEFEDDGLEGGFWHLRLMISEGIITDGKRKEERKDDNHWRADRDPWCESRSGEANSVKRVFSSLMDSHH